MNPADLGRIRTFLQLEEPAAQQQETLLRKAVRPNVSCEFGRRHDFARIRTVEDFRQTVPLCRYQDIEREIDRMVQGEPGVLVAEPVRRFFITSGSTAKPKYIPVTGSFIRDKWQAMQAYWGLVRQDHPQTSGGSVITNFSDGSRETRTPAGLLCGSESSFWNSWGKAPSRSAGSGLPHEVCRIADAGARYYSIARVLMEQDVSVLMALNPSTILVLLETVQDQFECLARDIEHGGLADTVSVDAELRARLAAAYPGNPRRARELSQSRTNGRAALTAAMWPNLQLVICWRSPMISPYLDLLAGYLGPVAQRDYMLMASEGVVAIPYEDNVSGGVLATGTHFYEFIPEPLADDPDAPTLLAHELQRGERYVTVITTSAGLYRYNLGDVIQVKDFLGSTPVLEFLHRTGHTCSLTGEKLTEDQVAEAVGKAAAELGLNLQGFTVYPVPTPFPHYGIVVEFGRATTSAASQSLLGEIDRELALRNVEYKAKRESRRLGALELWVVPPGSYAALRQQRAGTRVSDAQIKLPCLTREAQFRERFAVVHGVSSVSAA